MDFALDDIKKILKNDAEYLGRDDLFFDNVNSVRQINEKSLDWINNTMQDKEKYLENTIAPIVICDSSVKVSQEVLGKKAIVVVEQPKLSFSKVANVLFKVAPSSGIHSSAVVYPGAEIGQNVRIGPNTVIYDCVTIGDNVEIGANNTIGADGFGYEKNEKDGTLYKFPHLKGVIISDDVEIGNNTCIDRGALEDTVIGNGTKIDNLVHIAHNVRIGTNCSIIATCIISGSVVIGDNCWVAPNATIREHIEIGEDSLIGLGAVVTKPVESNSVISGFPALPFKKMISIFKGLLGS